MTELAAIPEPEGLEGETVTLMEAASGRYPCLTWGPHKASFWAEAEAYGPADFQLHVLSRFPSPYPEDYTMEKYPRLVPQHCVDIEIGEVGLAEFLRIDPGWPRKDEWLAKWLLEEGLAPGQPFRVVAEARYVGHTSMEWIGTEWDLEVDWEIAERAYLEPEEAARRWEEYLAEFKGPKGEA